MSTTNHRWRKPNPTKLAIRNICINALHDQQLDQLGIHLEAKASLENNQTVEVKVTGHGNQIPGYLTVRVRGHI